MKKLATIVTAAALSLSLLPTAAFAADLCAGQQAGAPQEPANQAVSLTTQSTVKTKATKKMHAKYKVVLRNAQNGKGRFSKAYWGAYSRVGWMTSYAMHDINKDGTPELFVNAGTCSADTRWYVFTMKSGKAKFVGKFGDGYTSLYSGKGKAIYGQGFHMGVAKVYRATLKGTAFKPKRVVLDTAELKGYPKMAKYANSHNLKFIQGVGCNDYSLINKAHVTK